MNAVLVHGCLKSGIMEGVKQNICFNYCTGSYALRVNHSFERPGSVYSLISPGVTSKYPFNLDQWLQRSLVLRCCLGMCLAG